MCFVKTVKVPETKSIAQEPVERKEADAISSKASQAKMERDAAGYKQNIKTSAFGLEDEAQVGKKTLLGE